MHSILTPIHSSVPHEYTLGHTAKVSPDLGVSRRVWPPVSGKRGDERRLRARLNNPVDDVDLG